MDGSFYGLLFMNPENIFRDLALIYFSYRPLELTEPFRDTATKILEVAYGCAWQMGYIEGSLKPNNSGAVVPTSPPAHLLVLWFSKHRSLTSSTVITSGLLRYAHSCPRPDLPNQNL